MTNSDNTIQVEGLSDFLKIKKDLMYQKRWQKLF